MKLKSMTFTDDDDGSALPSTITVEMTTIEALAWTLFLGQLNGHAHRKLRLSESNGYNCMTGDVFNRYWDDGTEQAARELGVCRFTSIEMLNQP